MAGRIRIRIGPLELESPAGARKSKISTLLIFNNPRSRQGLLAATFYLAPDPKILYPPVFQSLFQYKGRIGLTRMVREIDGSFFIKIMLT